MNENKTKDDQHQCQCLIGSHCQSFKYPTTQTTERERERERGMWCFVMISEMPLYRGN